MSQRHTRKRSSVSVKKRCSRDQSPGVGSSSKTLGSPYPEDNAVDKQPASTTPHFGPSILTMSPETDTGQLETMKTTTRTEVDLFVDDDDEHLIEAPRMEKDNAEHTVSPSVKVLAHIPNGQSARYSEAGKSSRGGSPSSSVGGNRDGSMQKPLLSNSAVRSAIQRGPLSASPSRAQFQSSPIRRVPQRGKRMSLNYISSPATSRFSEIDRSATVAYESITPSTIGTPGTSAPTSSSNGYFGRQDINEVEKMAVPMTASSTRSCSATSASPTLSKMSKKEDGDTVMTQHKDLLERIAEKERKIFELKENLAREEKELKKLQQTWQASVNKEIAIHQPSMPVPGGDAAAPAGLLGTSADSELRRRELFQQPGVVAADGWKVLSATLAGAGTQINALIDQLASPIEVDPKNVSKISNSRMPVVKEKVEGDIAPAKIPANPSNPVSKANFGDRVEKRTSMFGASMAALQKQVDAFSGLDGSTEATPKAVETTNTGWGTWQKRLKEARENATGLLAKAEQRLGQALVTEDPTKAATATEQISTRSVKEKRTTDSQSRYDFSGENDREKAALAELTWLNSLAGVNMSGTTDRVTTSLPTVKGSQKDAASPPQARFSKNGMMDARRISNASQSSTGSRTKGIPSPPHSISNESDSTQKSGESTGLFSLASTAMSTVDTESVTDDDKDREHRRRSGQSKTRNAALAAVSKREEVLKDSRFINTEAIKSLTRESGLVKVVEASGEHDDAAWGLQ